MSSLVSIGTTHVQRAVVALPLASDRACNVGAVHDHLQNTGAHRRVRICAAQGARGCRRDRQVVDGRDRKAAVPELRRRRRWP